MVPQLLEIKQIAVSAAPRGRRQAARAAGARWW
jgi:hypothetical protein